RAAARSGGTVGRTRWSPSARLLLRRARRQVAQRAGPRLGARRLVRRAVRRARRGGLAGRLLRLAVAALRRELARLGLAARLLALGARQPLGRQVGRADRELAGRRAGLVRLAGRGARLLAVGGTGRRARGRIELRLRIDL